MKAISLWEPWASLVSGRHKLVETRDWYTKHRGDIAIAATMGIPMKWLGESRYSPQFLYFLPAEMTGVVIRNGDGREGMKALCRSLPRGCVLCLAELYDVLEITPELVNDLTPKERAFGNYSIGRYAWFLRDIRTFKTPIPAKGNRRIWNWEPPAQIELVSGGVWETDAESLLVKP